MDQEQIGKFILKLRKEKNMSQMELASKLGITDRAISKWENGKCLPDISLMQPLCNELGISINELLSGEKNNAYKDNVMPAIKYSLTRIIKNIIFYLITFFSGIFVVPVLGLIAPSFIVFGIISLLSGLIKIIGYIFNFNVPFVVFETCGASPHPIIIFIISIILGFIFSSIGASSWLLLQKYSSFIKTKILNNIKINQ